MSETKLKRCPFCGGEAMMNTVEPHTHSFATWMPDYSGGTFIECSECSCGISGDTEEEAISQWNTRKPMREIMERLEREKVNKIFAGRSNGKTLKTGINYGIATAIEVVKEVGGINE